MSYLETRIVKSSREPIKIVQNRPHDGHWGIHWREKEERETNTAGSRRTKRIRRGWRIERKEKGREKDESGGGGGEREKKETTGPERGYSYKNDLRLTGACRSCGEPGKTWWQRGNREKWTDGYFSRCQLVYSATPTHQLSGRSPLETASLT